MKGIAILLAFGFIGVTACTNYNETKNPESVVINDIDLQTVSDGVHRGSHRSFPVNVIVDVVVTNHVILRIDLVKHFNGQGQAAESIPGEVVARQNLMVDAVSGATVSSKCILKAIEDALTE